MKERTGARPFFLVPTTSERLLRRLYNSLNYTNFDVENKLTFKFRC